MEDLALFQYVKGVGIGFLAGLGFGWLMWRLPVHLRTRHTRKLRQIVLDLKRIEAAFVGVQGAPNHRELRTLRIPWRIKITEAWERWCEETKPRSPEAVARMTYERELAEVL